VIDLDRPWPASKISFSNIIPQDYDCFYAQVIENQNPQLKAVPLGVKQKGILATCNYEARRRGVTKLMQIFEATKICPDLVLADGEDLSPFRDVSKRLYSLLEPFSWNKKIERLGLDEVFLDVTDLVAYNVELLNSNTLQQSFFCLSREDPEQGFPYDASAVSGCVHGSPPAPGDPSFTQYLRILVASHLAHYLRLKLEEEGYTCACGISSSKLLSKLAGNKNKPRNQTAIVAFGEDAIVSFMDEHKLRKVPGIGGRTTRLLEGHVLSKEMDPSVYTMECSVTVGQVRAHPGMSVPTLEKLLGGPGSEKGIGEKVWGLLHGVDNTEVKPASLIPTQISIEDTYKGLHELSEINRELRALSTSLLRRMHVDLVEEDPKRDAPGGSQRWVAHPKTIRLTTRPKTSPSDAIPYNAGRTSRSQPMPNFIFSFSMLRDAIIEKLASEVLLPMFLKLNPAQRQWNIGLINICAANMVVTGNDDGLGSGRDISAMFRRQEDVLREWTVYSDDGVPQNQGQGSPPNVDGEGAISGDNAPAPNDADFGNQGAEEEEDSGTKTWEEDGWHGTEHCHRCDLLIPAFALLAHQRYHATECD
jgi:DNA polymerase iota